MEILELFLQRPARFSGCSAVLTICDKRRVERKNIRKFRSYQGAKSVATFSGMSPAESTGGQGCDLYVSKWRRRLCFRKPEARSSLDVIFRRQALQARGVGEPKRAAQPWATRSHRLRSASLGAPLSDTDLETQAQKTVQVISLRSLLTEAFLVVYLGAGPPMPF